jgi:hypothetical protein
MAGWIKLHRSIMDNSLWRMEKFTQAQAWIDLLLTTNFKDGFFSAKNGEKVSVKRGECGHSIVTLSERWMWSRGKVSRFLNFLESQKMIQQKREKTTTIITICNYEAFQMEQQTGHQTVQQTGHQTVHQTGHQTVHQTVQQTVHQTVHDIRKKEGEKGRREEGKNKDTPLPPQGGNASGVGDNSTRGEEEQPKPKRTRFVPPTVSEVRAYCLDRGNGINPEEFVDFYAAKGWRVGKANSPMKDWQASVRTWEHGRDKKKEEERRIEHRMPLN